MKVVRKLTIWTRNRRGELTYETDWKIMRDGILVGFFSGLIAGILIVKFLVA